MLNLFEGILFKTSDFLLIFSILLGIAKKSLVWLYKFFCSIVIALKTTFFDDEINENLSINGDNSSINNSDSEHEFMDLEVQGVCNAKTIETNVL